MSEVTRILSQIEAGDPAAAERLLPLVYKELRQLAAAKLANEHPGQTLQATALVHEAYLRLVNAPERQKWDGCGHFFAAAAEAMRRILVENARRKQRAKRGGNWTRVDLGAVPDIVPIVHEDLIALDTALDRLRSVDPHAVQLVHLRYFVGLSNAEAAKSLGISSRTADRVWAFARAWLRREIGETNAVSKEK
jgi:RNA polymerase sigma factor (TIGR02999 family)